MPKGRGIDREVLEAAVVGLECRRAEIEEKIATLQRMIGGRARAKASGPAPVAKKRVMSAAGKKRIAEAARKRWAEYNKKKKGAEKATET